MRKLKLQMQVSVDGFMAGPAGELDWMNWEEDEEHSAFINHLTDTSDTILLGRKMTEGFVKYWEGVITKPDSPEYEFGMKMVNMAKVVFSQSVMKMDGKNIRVENRPLLEAVNGIKREKGKDIIVYGGATFVTSLIENRLIDELNLFINPVAIGRGLRVFTGRVPLELEASRAFKNGIVVNTYVPQTRQQTAKFKISARS